MSQLAYSCGIFFEGEGANCYSGFSQCPPLLQVTGHFWLRNQLPALLASCFLTCRALFRGTLTWNKCPGSSWVLQGEDVFRNPAARALSGRVPGVKDLGGGRLRRTGTLGAGRGGNPDSHSPLPLTSVNYQSHAFCKSLPRSFAFLFLFP